MNKSRKGEGDQGKRAYIEDEEIEDYKDHMHNHSNDSLQSCHHILCILQVINAY